LDFSIVIGENNSININCAVFLVWIYPGADGEVIIF